MMGGPAKIMTKGKKLYDQGKYLEASEILNRLVFAQPKNQAAKNLTGGCLRADRLPEGKSESAQQLPPRGV